MPAIEVRPAMADLAVGGILSRDLGGRAAAFRHAPDAADVRRREIDVAVVAPVAAAMTRRVGERLQRRAAHRDLPELGPGEERDPLAVGGEEGTVAALGAVERLRRGLAQRADVDLGLAVAKPDVGDARAVIGQRDRQQIGRAQLVAVGQRDADVRDAAARGRRRRAAAIA